MKKVTSCLAALFTMAFIFSASSVMAQWNLTGNSNATATSLLGTTNSISLRLATKNTPRLIIDTLGRVGIGLTSPATQLMVKGSGTIPAALWTNIGKPVFGGFGETNVGNADFILGMASSTLFNAIPRFAGRRSRGTLAVPTAVTNGDQLMSFSAFGFDGTAFQNPAEVAFTVDGTQSGTAVPTSISMATGTNGVSRTERMRIGSSGDIAFNTNQLFVQKSTGNVSIGTATPATGYKLTVTGKIICTEMKVQLQPFPDYVFANDYKLLSINDVESHIKNYHRLPGMPSAADIETNGMDVGKMQGKVVEKVEEATLYIIQLNKENKDLKQQLTDQAKMLEEQAKAIAALQTQMASFKK